MPTRVRNLRQMRRGFEADVTLGTEGPPGASVTMKVLVSIQDPEFAKVRSQLEKLLTSRAETALRSTLDYAETHDTKGKS